MGIHKDDRQAGNAQNTQSMGASAARTEVRHTFDDALLAEVKRTLILSSLVAGMAFRGGLTPSPANWNKLIAVANTLLEGMASE